MRGLGQTVEKQRTENFSLFIHLDPLPNQLDANQSSRVKFIDTGLRKQALSTRSRGSLEPHLQGLQLLWRFQQQIVADTW